jgi:hypothetical protein
MLARKPTAIIKKRLERVAFFYLFIAIAGVLAYNKYGLIDVGEDANIGKIVF